MMRHRQSQNEGIGIDPSREMQQSAQRDRHHEQVDQEKIQREHPNCSANMAGIDVLHYGNLELARQQQRSKECQRSQRHPAAITS